MEFLAERCIGRRVRIIAAHVTQQAHELVERRLVNSAPLFETLPRAGLERGQIRSRTPDSDNRHVEVTAPGHGL